jgi:hypothetical protein
MSVVVKTRRKKAVQPTVPAPPAPAARAPKARGIRRLPSAERIQELFRRFEENAKARGVPSDLAAWIEGRARSALSKSPGQLSEDEKRALIAFRYLASPSGMGADVRRESKKVARLVSAWLKRGRSDIPGIDEPSARPLFGAIRGAVKRHDWERLRGILEGGPIRRVGRRKKAAPAPAQPVTQTPAPATSKKKGGRKKRAVPVPTQPVPEEAPPEAVAQLAETLGPLGVTA